MKRSKAIRSSMGLLGIILCAACCALPIVGGMLGVGILSVLSKYFEWAGAMAGVLGVLVLVVYLLRKKKAPTCDV